MKKFGIKCLLLLAFILFSSSLLNSQNLIDNPGFEDGMDHWWGFGSTEGTGSGTIVSTPVHSGTKALKIEYPGMDNWNFLPGSLLSVLPGQIYDVSCWAKTDTDYVIGQAKFTFTLYDSARNAIN